MGYAVRDRLEVSIYINDVEFPLDPGSANVLNFLHMAASVKFRMPTCHFSITDVSHVLDSVNLQDAIPIRFAVKGNTAKTQVYTFRKFNHSRDFNGTAMQYEIDGYLDSVKFWTGTSAVGISGTSDTALSQIAQTCGLKYDGTKTNDSMVWMPGNRKYHAFASEIEEAGYVDNASFMKWAIDLDGTLRYRNISALQDSGKVIVAHQQQPDMFMAIDYGATAQSGFNNASLGYLNSRYVQSAIDAGAVLNQLQVTADSRSPMYNKKAREQSGRGRVTFSPINFGSVHSQYEQAIYQNARFQALYGLELEVLMNSPSTINLLEQITFATELDNRREDKGYSGKYVVTGKVIYLKGLTYAEKLFLTRMGLNQDYISA